MVLGLNVTRMNLIAQMLYLATSLNGANTHAMLHTANTKCDRSLWQAGRYASTLDLLSRRHLLLNARKCLMFGTN